MTALAVPAGGGGGGPPPSFSVTEVTACSIDLVSLDSERESSRVVLGEARLPLLCFTCPSEVQGETAVATASGEKLRSFEKVAGSNMTVAAAAAAAIGGSLLCFGPHHPARNSLSGSLRIRASFLQSTLCAAVSSSKSPFFPSSPTRGRAGRRKRAWTAAVHIDAFRRFGCPRCSTARAGDRTLHFCLGLLPDTSSSRLSSSQSSTTSRPASSPVLPPPPP